MLRHDWSGSCVHTESTFHQLAPYIGKLKSSIAAALVEEYTRPGDVVLDPFVGAGTIALEAAVRDRSVLASDVNPYAVLLTRAKLFAPSDLSSTLDKARNYLRTAERASASVDLRRVPPWVRHFFNPRTLREVIAVRDVLIDRREYFLLGCLLGILHHQRPGFLSYPSSHLVPYLRNNLFPRARYPEMYEYRDVASRLTAKITRAFRRSVIIPSTLSRKCRLADIRNLRVEAKSVDAVISSPPYMNALDYVRDNRLRLWFLGVNQSNPCSESPRNEQAFVSLMRATLFTMRRALRDGGKCILVVGEANRSARGVDAIAITRAMIGAPAFGFREETVLFDKIPDVRRARRTYRSTKRECVIVASAVAT
jgi:hypothetical protein